MDQHILELVVSNAHAAKEEDEAFDELRLTEDHVVHHHHHHHHHLHLAPDLGK
jgi:hypothetical protein